MEYTHKGHNSGVPYTWTKIRCKGMKYFPHSNSIWTPMVTVDPMMFSLYGLNLTLGHWFSFFSLSQSPTGPWDKKETKVFWLGDSWVLERQQLVYDSLHLRVKTPGMLFKYGHWLNMLCREKYSMVFVQKLFLSESCQWAFVVSKRELLCSLLCLQRGRFWWFY